MDVEARIQVLERRCRLLFGSLISLVVLCMATLLMGAAESTQPTDVVAKSLTLVDAQGNPRIRLFSTEDKAALALMRADGRVGAWLQVNNSESVLNIHQPNHDDKTGVVLYATAQHEGVAITSANGELKWHAPE